MLPLANLTEHFSTSSHYSLWKHRLLASVMGTVHGVLWWSQNFLMPLLQCPACLCGHNTTVELLIQPHAEEYSLTFTDVECTHYISHNPINKHVFHPHYINLDPINKQIECSHSSLRYPLQKESYCPRIHHRAGLQHQLPTKRPWLWSLLYNRRAI